MAIARRDYSLNGEETRRAWEKGLVSADWYQSPVPRARLKELMKRRNFPALWHLFLWFALIAGLGVLTWLTWGTWWMVPVYFAYCTILGGSSDPRWHEFGHGTATAIPWLNDAVYNFASFFLLREPTIWRWSHTRHHTDTIIVGRDPEIITPRPPNFRSLLFAAFNLNIGVKAIRHVFIHACGKKTFPEEDFVPESEWWRVYLAARVWIAIWFGVIALAIAIASVLPIALVLVPPFVGFWIALFFGVTQHLALADDVLDHRLCTRTVYMNPVLRFLYLNMNYHVEHHMFPLVPYHALPKLHEEIKADCPPPCPSVWAAYRELVPTLFKQRRDPELWIHKELPQAPAEAKVAAAAE